MPQLTRASQKRAAESASASPPSKRTRGRASRCPSVEVKGNKQQASEHRLRTKSSSKKQPKTQAKPTHGEKKELTTHSKDTPCSLCAKKNQGSKMLLCDGCDKGAHMFCLSPPLRRIPRGDWFCPDCTSMMDKAAEAARAAIADSSQASPPPKKIAGKRQRKQQDGSPGGSDTALTAPNPSPKTPQPTTPTAGTPGSPAGTSIVATPVQKEAPAGLSEVDPSETSAKPQDPLWFDPLDRSKVQRAKAVLQTAVESEQVMPLCRGEQHQQITGALKGHLLEATSGSIFVSGLPGTGKTYTTDLLVRQCPSWAVESSVRPVKPAVLWVNCMSLMQPSQIFQRLLGGIYTAQSGSGLAGSCNPIVTAEGAASVRSTTAEAKAELQDLLTSLSTRTATGNRRAKVAQSGREQGMVVAVLDEIDVLMTGDHSVLSDLFLLTALQGSRLILIGISNSIDLTERTLPHLIRQGVSPSLVPFPAYSKAALSTLLQFRLEGLPGPVFAKPAIEFACRKIGSGSGDMRQLLQAARGAIDTLVEDTQPATSQQDKSAGSPATPAPATPAAATAMASPSSPSSPANPSSLPGRLVGIRQMASGISKLQGACGHEGAVKAIRSLSREQQTVLCAAVRLLGSWGGGTQGSGSSGMPKVHKIGKKATLSGSFRQLKSLGPRQRGAFGPAKDKTATTDRCDCVMAELHDMYLRLCRRAQVESMNLSEFNGVCNNLTDQALINLSPSPHDRQRRVTLRVSEDDVAMALQDIRFFKAMLQTQ